MRQETNNEIDLLLRRLSRRQGVPVSDADLRLDSDHLDADELSSYAENALPAAARSRYTEHLAECSGCRELVVQLNASVPVIAAKETVTASEPSGLRSFLASFFTPMVLRYAVPALGLIVVAAIGFVVLRSNQRGADVALLDGQAPTSPAAIPSPEPQPSKTLYDSQERTEAQPPPTRPPDAERSRDTAGQVSPPPNAPPSVRVTVTPKTAEAAQNEEAVANVAPAQSAPTPTPTVDEMRIEVEGRKTTDLTRVSPAGDLAKQRTADSGKEQEKKAESSQPASERPAKPGIRDTRVQTGETTSTFGLQEGREKNRDDGVIRSVAGRRFRKQSGVWVDTAYDSGSAIVNVARGSEQYRALIADEPSIKTIADQLDGQIIVVWKGRTYRIR